ncbi:Histone-lysine N-methyltransferase ASHH2 [Euphorbia peplus]|nr:Histone-lysine N-methyltransferase ASHH2 [Euphorbia peplus]
MLLVDSGCALFPVSVFIISMDVEIDALAAVMESESCPEKFEEDNDNASDCVPVASLKKSEVDCCIQPCSTQRLEVLESSPVEDSLGGTCSQENDKSVSSPFEEGVSGVVEEESDVTTEVKVDEKLCMEGNPGDLKEDSPEIPPNCLESCWPDTTENVSSGELDASHCLGKPVFGGVESCEVKYIEEKDLAGNNSPPKSRCTKNVPSSSRKSSRIQKSSHKTQTKRASRRCKNKVKVPDADIFTAERRRRTCSSKPARSSNWGLFGNIDKYFEHINGLGRNEIENFDPSKTNISQESRKRNKSRDCGSTQGSTEKKNTSTTGIRLKVKLGKEVCQTVIVPEVFDTSALAAANDFETKSNRVPSFSNGFEDKIGAEGIEEQHQCFENNLEEEAKVHSDTSTLDLHLADKDLEGAVVSQKLTGDVAGDCFGPASHIEVEESVAVIQKCYIDPGTSPDSEVINLVPDGQDNTRSPENFPDTVLPSIDSVPGVISSTKRGKKKDIVSHASDCFPGEFFPQFSCTNKAKSKKKQGSKESKDNGIFSSNASSNSSCRKDLSEELSRLPSENDTTVPREALQEENKLCIGLDAGHNLVEAQYSNHLLPSKKSKGNGLPKKSTQATKGRSKARNNRENGCKQRLKEHKSVKKNKVHEKNDGGDNDCRTEDDKKTGSCVLDDDTGKINTDNNVATVEAPNLDIASGIIAEQHIPVDNAWVSCDDCHKWRRIPVALVDSIGQTNCQWICKDNADKAFADCSISQEKSNAEINAELGISDVDEDAYGAPSKSKGLECKRPGFISNEHEFTRILSNHFLHRSRKFQTIDEIMVCHCKLPQDGGLGCGDECLNRMLNIECVKGTCPCGDLCSNQQFQKRNYVKMKWDRCGKKGFGLRLEEDIPKGHFLIEYVGEVLDMHTYEARQKEYAFNSHKHFYFMTLNGSEVIDACAKGNLGRFINHSCDPNCRTEKWVVNGEICIGLFALRDIKKDEEVTFDYNYVRVFGAAAKKCYCGASNCRGYIGGDPTSTEVIDQVDSDEEFLEPVMLEHGHTRYTLKKGVPRSSSVKSELRVADVSKDKLRDAGISKDKIKMDHPIEGEVKLEEAEVKLEEAEVQLEVASEINDAINESDSVVCQSYHSLESDDLKEIFPSCQQVESSDTLDEKTDKTVAAKDEISMEDSQRCETSSSTMVSKSSSDSTITKLKSKSPTVEERRVFVKSRFLMKPSRESLSSKKGKVTNNHLNASKFPMSATKSQMLSVKPKKLMNGANGRFEAVEEKLNELLDVDGGISKRKDAAKSYLKFLVHTAASGASGNGEAIQSNRDLSIILDALLKTKSKIVLLDIVNKNGLRMLHNMIKLYRKDFKKTPILRKLLKVLEHLAQRDIITQDHINGGPPCPGMESFKDSILSLTEHVDKQVHQIARNFRDRWIPRHSRRHSNMDREDQRMDFHRGSTSNRIQNNHLRDVAVRPIEAIDCAVQPKPAPAPVDPASGETKRRKRKSRWDQPSSRWDQLPDEKPCSTSEHNPQPDTGKGVLDHADKGTSKSYCPDCARNYGRQGETSGRLNNIQTDVPPGFSPILVVSPGEASTNLPEQDEGLKFPIDMVVGYQQKKFNSRFPVSYGFPMPIVQQFGSPQDGTKESWAVAPGMPFYPFPPLPPFPPQKKEGQISPTVIDETRENHELRHDNNPSTTGSNQPDMVFPGEDEQQSLKRARESPDLGRMYFRQQKWNKMPPSCIRNRDGWGYMGSNSRAGISNNDVGNVTYEERNSFCSQEVSCGVDKAAGNCINQQNSTLN